MVALHFYGLYSSLQLCCEVPRFTSIQEAGCDKGAHHQEQAQIEKQNEAKQAKLLYSDLHRAEQRDALTTVESTQTGDLNF